ncbi:MAG TPA: 3-phosphoshikimate 1-carboxyvinyltransferase [Eubacterium sp.]|nr:3-phosphoshikimate 1-carboxyvinyltransferase [Eubacterium sp.]
MIFKRKTNLTGTITVPGDKSISHRAIMLGSLANGTTTITNFLMGADCLSTIDCFRKMGVDIDVKDDKVTIQGVGLHGLKKPSETLDVGNSGTTTRLISGILAAQNFSCRLDGDDSLRKRPMKRIITPLSQMGADIKSENDNGCVPLIINGKKLKGIHYDSPVASAQIKSSILLAGLYADGETSVTEPSLSRNHSEIMFNQFGIDCKSEGTTATVKKASDFNGIDINVPGDISSAAYFLVLGLITPNSEITVKNVGINPTRDGIIKVIEMMGGNITLSNVNNIGEKTADITVKTSELHGCTIGGDIIPTLIDEIPVIAVMAAYAKGKTIIKDAAELKVKESNRIDIMVSHLKAMGCDIKATDDGMIINENVEEPNKLTGCKIDSALDHRIAMSFAICGLNADGETDIPDSEVVKISYPNFYEDLESLV